MTWGILSPGLSMMDQHKIKQRQIKENSSKRSQVQEQHETKEQIDKSILAKVAECHNIEKEVAHITAIIEHISTQINRLHNQENMVDQELSQSTHRKARYKKQRSKLRCICYNLKASITMLRTISKIQALS